MDYVRSGFGMFSSSSPASSSSSAATAGGAEIVERLVNRVTSSTLLDDRRDAVRGIKSLSRKYRLEVGTQGMPALVEVLRRDQSDAEITGYALDALFNVMNTTPLGEDDEDEEDDDETEEKKKAERDETLGLQFTEIFIKDPSNISLLSELLDEYDFHIRWPTVKLLLLLLTNASKVVQEALMSIPMAISKMMDLLSDSREVVRNDGLLLLIHLTKGNSNIQKIVAFENAFERLLDIVDEEEMSDGGVVVEDCLTLLLNLLKNNSSNQTFFKEGSFVKRLTPYFDFSQHEGGWSAQKVQNLHLMIQLVRCLVSPSNPAQNTTSCQKAMHASGLLDQLCKILMASGIPADILTETINAISEVIRGSPDNQSYFASVTAPTSPPRPAFIVLLLSMVNEKQPFILRLAVLYCFQSYLFRHESAQQEIMASLLPTTQQQQQQQQDQPGVADSISAGQILCSGLFKNDVLSNWFAGVALKSVVDDNLEMKRQLLRVQLATSMGQPPTTLLQQCCNMLQSPRLQTRLGILSLLSTWTAGCPEAVALFLKESTNVAYLISQISSTEGEDSETVAQGVCAFLLALCVHCNDDSVENFTRASLRQIIQQRIGMETFFDKLNSVTKHELYNAASKHTQPKASRGEELLVDWGFTRLFKTLEASVIRSVQGDAADSSSPSGGSSTSINGIAKDSSPEAQAETDKMLQRYKDSIIERDHRLLQFQQQAAAMSAQNSALDKYAREAQEAMQRLQDENALLKAARKGEDVGGRSGASEVEGASRQAEVVRLQGEIEALAKDNEVLRTDLAAAHVELVDLEQAKADDASTISNLQIQISSLRVNDNGRDDETRREAETRTLIDALQNELETLKKQVIFQEAEVGKYKTQYENVLEQLRTMEEAKEADEEGNPEFISSYLERLKAANMEKLDLQERLNGMEAVVSENHELRRELEVCKKDQDDFFVLLSGEEEKKNKYRQMLKSMNVDISDSSEDDDDDDSGGGGGGVQSATPSQHLDV